MICYENFCTFGAIEIALSRSQLGHLTQLP